MEEDKYAKKSMGQHWLEDQASLEKIVEFAEIKGIDTILEIGPGKGALTKYLVDNAKKVIAVEFDEALAQKLPSIVDSPKLEVYNEDCLKFDYSKLPKGYKVVANIPYYLTSNLLRVLSENENPPQAIILLIQKEVAERVAAEPGSMSMLSVSVQLYYQAELGVVVSADKFNPVPKIDSQVVKLIKYEKPLFNEIDTIKYFKIVKAGFSQRRKKLRTSLSSGLNISKNEVEQILIKANIEPNLRPQQLSLEQWYDLYKILNG